MRRRAATTLLVATLLLGSHLSTPPAALACSGSIDPVHDNDLIFMGRVVGLELASDPHDESAFAAVWVIFEVDRYLLGDGPRELRALDTGSVAFMGGQTPEQREAMENPEWVGGGGACGTLDEDPRGQYWLTGVSLSSDSPYSSEAVLHLNRIALHMTGGIGTGPDDPHILERLTAIEALLTEAGIPPAVAGHGPLEASRDIVPTLVASGATIALALLGRRATSR